MYNDLSTHISSMLYLVQISMMLEVKAPENGLLACNGALTSLNAFNNVY